MGLEGRVRGGEGTSVGSGLGVLDSPLDLPREARRGKSRAGGSGSGRGPGARTVRLTSRVGRVSRRAGPVARPDGKRRKRETRRRVARRRARWRGGGRGRFAGEETRENGAHGRTRDWRVVAAPRRARPKGGSVATVRYPRVLPDEERRTTRAKPRGARRKTRATGGAATMSRPEETETKPKRSEPNTNARVEIDTRSRRTGDGRTCTTSRPPAHDAHRVSPVSRQNKFVSSPLPDPAVWLGHGVKYVDETMVGTQASSAGKPAGSCAFGTGDGQRGRDERRRVSALSWRNPPGRGD